MDKKFKLSDISIISAHEVNTNVLHTFYRTVFPTRPEFPRIWKWLNRSSFYDNKTPLVVLYDGCVIAYIGMIPFNTLLDRKYYTTTIGIDLAVLPEFQRSGIGFYLVKKWMELSDLCVGFPNKRAMRIYEKYGWIKSSHTYLHYYFLRPFNHPRYRDLIPKYLRWILNISFRPFIYVIYRKYASSIDDINFEEINSKSIDEFLSSLKMPNNIVSPVRDSKYITWRLLNSPDKDKYRVLSVKNVKNISFIIKLYNKHEVKYIDILWMSNTSDLYGIRDLISTLAIWGINNNYSYIRYYFTKQNLSDYLKKSLKSFVAHPPFVYYSNDLSLLRKLEHFSWHLELIDGDFEEF